MSDVYTITFAKGTSVHDEQHFQRHGVSARGLAETIATYQRRGFRVIRVEVDS